MSYFINICFICLKYSNSLTFISSPDTNETSFEDKLKYFLPGFEFKSSIPKYICAKCGRNLSRIREFKQKCLQNITTYEKYAQQITTTDSSFKYLSVDLSPNFVVLKSETEINVDAINSEETIIKEEMNEKLILDDESKLLILEIKQEMINNKNEDIIEENVQISANSTEKPKILENEKLNKCEICSKSFRHLKQLKKHKYVHTGKKPHTCEICNASFISLNTLKKHHLRHFGEKPHICEVCYKSFRLPSALRQHKHIHTGENRFICEVCKKSFSRREYLRQHQFIHSGKKRFSCKDCNKSFNFKCNLKKHLKGICPRKSSKKQTFDSHKKNNELTKKIEGKLRVHNGAVPYFCEHCCQSFEQLIHLCS